MPKKIDRSVFVNAAVAKFGAIKTISRQQVVEVCDETGIAYPTWLTNDPANRAGRGMYALPTNLLSKTAKSVAKPAPVVETSSELAVADMAMAAVKLDTPDQVSLIPSKAAGYVPFGHFNDVRSIIKIGRAHV